MYQGKSVYLTEYRLEELKDIMDLINDWEIQSTLHPGPISPLSHEDHVDWFHENRKNRSQSHAFAIRTLKDDIYIGRCAYNSVDHKNRFCFIGIMINHKRFQNKGHGTEALSLLINYIFNELNLRKIYLKVFASNERAIHVYKKLGFEVEGVLKKHLFRNGEYIDDLIMAKYRDF